MELRFMWRNGGLYVALALGVLWMCAWSPMPSAAVTVPDWMTYARDPQHTALSSQASQSLTLVRWSTPVDVSTLSDPILIHYGSPLVTPGNTVIVPVKTGSAGGYRVEARNGPGRCGCSGRQHRLHPSAAQLDAELLADADREQSRSTSPAPAAPSTSATTSTRATGSDRPAGLLRPGELPGQPEQLRHDGLRQHADHRRRRRHHLLRISHQRQRPARAAERHRAHRCRRQRQLGLGGRRVGRRRNITRVPHQAAPALSNDEQTLYVRRGERQHRHETPTWSGLDPATLALKESSPGVKMRVALKDPRNGGANNANVSDDSSASPMVGPDGDVYYGVLGNPFNGSRGWMLHFSGDLTQTKTPGAFGWDTTASGRAGVRGAVVQRHARPT